MTILGCLLGTTILGNTHIVTRGKNPIYPTYRINPSTRSCVNAKKTWLKSAEVGSDSAAFNDFYQNRCLFFSLLGGIKTKPIDKEPHFPETTFDINLCLIDKCPFTINWTMMQSQYFSYKPNRNTHSSQCASSLNGESLMGYGWRLMDCCSKRQRM